MPERLDPVSVSLNRGEVGLSWDSRQALTARMQHVRTTARIRDAFDAVGASRSVELGSGQRTALLIVLEAWSLDLDGYEPMPQELFCSATH